MKTRRGAGAASALPFRASPRPNREFSLTFLCISQLTLPISRPIPTASTVTLRDNTVTLVTPTRLPEPAHTVKVQEPAPIIPEAPPTVVGSPTTVESRVVAEIPTTVDTLTFGGALQKARATCSIECTSVPDTYEPAAVYWGILLVRPGPEQYLKAEWELVMQGKPPAVSANLVLRSAGLSDRVHDICRLNAPYMDEDKKCCVLATSGPVAEYSYYVQLQDDTQTREFADSLYGVQKLFHDIKAMALSGSPEPTSPPTPPPQPLAGAVGAVDDPAPVPTKLVELDNSDQATMDIEAIVDAVRGLDQITDALARMQFNPELFKTLDAITGEWFTTRYSEMNTTSCLNMTISVQDMLKRHIGIKQSEMVCEPGSKPPVMPESIKDLARPITYTPDELKALRGKAFVASPEYEPLSPQVAKLMLRP